MTVEFGFMHACRIEPYLFEGVTLEDVIHLMPQFTDVPWSGWLELAQLFLDDLGEGSVVRAP